MGKRIGACLVCAAIVFGFTAFASAQETATFLKSAEELWLKRSVSEQNVNEAIKFWQQAASSDPKSEEAFIGMAKSYYFLGRFSKGSKEAMYQKGIDAAKSALTLNPKGVGGNYWYVVCLAKSLEDKSLTTKMKYMSDIKSHIEAAVAADPKYYFGGPYRVSGMLYFKSPLASNKTAIENLRKSLEIAPEYSLTLVNLAEVLIKEKQYDEAKRLLEKALAVNPKPGFERETADDKELAKKLLASIPKP
jgi:tetratricopeptide (TPR) repeat protein